jgi:hypothetical protein
MRRTSAVRFLTSLIIASLAFAGPLAPLAQAQQRGQATDATPMPSASPIDVTQPVPTPPAETKQPAPTPPAEVKQPAPMPPTESTQDDATPPEDVAQAQPRPPAEPVQPVPPPPPMQPAPPMQPPPPAPPVPAAHPTQPDLFQETLKAQRASDRSQALYNLEAVFVSLFLFPGRIVTCAAGTVVGVGLLTISLGTGYRTATGIFHEGCGGKWIVTGDDLRPDTPPSLVVTEPGR